MNRAERRRQKKENQKPQAKYVYTKEYLNAEVEKAVKEKLSEERETILNETINQAMFLLFVLPMEVLMDFYWQKSYAKRIPEFTQHLIDYYTAWENGELDMEKMKNDLWEYGGVRLEEGERGIKHE